MSNTNIHTFERWAEKIPDWIPDAQIAKYRAMQRQRKCEEGKKRKKMERAKRLRNKEASSKMAR